MNYKILSQNSYTSDQYELIPIRQKDMESIRVWRNEQMDILRQDELLSQSDQMNYYNNELLPLFKKRQPNQLLFSFLKETNLIGYGGLVHINWSAKNGEISFLTETSRNNDINIFKKDFTVFLQIIKRVAFEELNFLKIYSTAYDLRPYLYEVLEQEGFEEEGRLRKHVCVNDELIDIVTHAILKN